MKNTIAVIAHYDAAGSVSDDLKLFIIHLAKECKRVVLVSTSLSDDTVDLPANVDVLRRQNVGYDFYSYKIGIKHAQAYHYENLLILNDSVYFLDPEKYIDALRRLQGLDYDICGITACGQFGFHLQSYCILFKKKVCSGLFFNRFWNSVELLSRKSDIIFEYEIGLTKHFVTVGYTAGVLFNPNLFSKIKAAWRTITTPKISKCVDFVYAALLLNRLKTVNYSHHLWDNLLAEFGIIKKEVVLRNPERLNLDGLNDLLTAEQYDFLSKAKKLSSSITNPLKNEGLFSCQTKSFETETVARTKIAVVIHLFYVDLLPDFRDVLWKFDIPIDVYVSVSSAEDALNVVNEFSRPGVRVIPYHVKNIGRDVYPFFWLLNNNHLDNYIAVCKLHSKKSKYSHKGDSWRKTLFDGVVPSSADILRIVSQFNNADTGLVGPKESFVSSPEYWGSNKNRVSDLCLQLGFSLNDSDFGFFAGTMFWVSQKILLCLKELDLTQDSFEFELGQRDGTMAHAIERLIGVIAVAKNYKIFCSRSDEVITVEQSINNKVDVLV